MGVGKNGISRRPREREREAEKEMDGLCEGGRKSGGPGCGRRECKMEDDNENDDDIYC